MLTVHVCLLHPIVRDTYYMNTVLTKPIHCVCLGEQHHTEADVGTQGGMYEEIQDVAASKENTGHMGPIGRTGGQTGPIYVNTPRDYLQPVTQAEYETPEAAVDERPRPAVYEELN